MLYNIILYLIEADAILQSKNVNIEAINEYIQLNEELKRYRLSTKDIRKLLNLIVAVKEYRYSPGKVVAKLRSIKSLENKEKRLKTSCEMLSKKEAKYKEIIPLANIIWDLHIGGSELISFKVAVNEAAEQYGFPRSTAAFHVLNNIRDYNKIGGLTPTSKLTQFWVCALETIFLVSMRKSALDFRISSLIHIHIDLAPLEDDDSYSI